MSATVKSIAESLYSDVPKQTLYHYTTLDGLLGIVRTGYLYATEIQYFNDASEMRHVAEQLQSEADSRGAKSRKFRLLYHYFGIWAMERLVRGHMLYVSCFSGNGNVLSQWRAYGGDGGSGVSLGFQSTGIQHIGQQYGFAVGHCEYDPTIQRNIVAQVLNAIEALAEEMVEDVDKPKNDSGKRLFGVFESIETDLLRIAVLLKHPSFREEDEWRAVSMLTKYVGQPIDYRATKSMLIPYVPFRLPLADVPPPVGQSRHTALGLDHVFVGPTLHVTQAVTSVDRFLAKHGALVKNGVEYCQIPFRTF